MVDLYGRRLELSDNKLVVGINVCLLNNSSGWR